MQYIRNTLDFYIEEDTVITLGKFDGIHRGHELLMEELKKQKENGLKTVIFTFDIPPRQKTTGDEGKVLTTNEEKEKLFERIGIDYLIECPFTPEVMCMEPEDFIRMLVEKLHMKSVVAGTDFHFGHNRRGDYQMLIEKSEEYGYIPKIVQKIQEDGRDISSTFIREELLLGNIEKANHLLGYSYFVQGEVVHGRKLGRTLNIPTLNLIPQPEKILPPFGVYVTQTYVDGKIYGGITNLGCKPTIKGDNPVGVETHLFEFEREIYGEVVWTEFLYPVRKEKKFASVEELKSQMEQDILIGKKMLTF